MLRLYHKRIVILDPPGCEREERSCRRMTLNPPPLLRRDAHLLLQFLVFLEVAAEQRIERG